MSWETLYLVCFVVGFTLSLLAFLAGAFHLPLSLKGNLLPGRLPILHGGLPHGHAAAGASPAGGSSSISPYNFSTLMAFLAWFGGVGYLLASRSRLGFLLVLVFAVASGLAGAGLVFGFLTKVLLAHERVLDAADFEMVGVLGRVTVGIRADGGTGEIVYSQAGTRRSSGARSEGGGAIARGSEVVVTRHEKGIAYVRLWEELTGAGEERQRT
jgi:hypothetical protein